MVESEDEVVKITRQRHKIYCDECGELLDEVIEHSDGYYMNEHEKEIRIHIPEYGKFSMPEIDGSDYVLKKDLCTKCYKKLTDNIINALTSLGFKKFC